MRRLGRAAAARASAATATGEHSFGHGPGAAAATLLLAKQLSGCTRDTNAANWASFVDF